MRGIEAGLDFLLTILDQLDLEAVGQAIADFFVNLNWGELMSEWGEVVGTAIGGILDGIDLSSAIGIGANIVGGMLSGWANKWNESGGFLGMVKQKYLSPLVDGIKSFFGIHSPSTVFAEIGENLIAGLDEGVSDTWEDIADFFEKSSMN